MEGSPYLVVLRMLKMVLYECSQESMVQSYRGKKRISRENWELLEVYGMIPGA